MTGLNHAITGATVAAAINRPWVALPAAFASHFIVDMLPHWDHKVPGGPKDQQVAMAVDLTLSVSLLIILAVSVQATPLVIFLGGILAITPDIMWVDYLFSGQKIKYSKKGLLGRMREYHHKIQWSETKNGLYFEIFWFIFMFFLIFKVQN